MRINNKSVVLYGDSLLGRFGKDLIVKLEGRVQDITVFNCATGGSNTEDGVKRADFIAQLNPDYVVLSFGANDAAPWKKQVSIGDFESNLDSIIKSFTRSKVIVFLCPPANDVGDKEITQFNDLLIRYNEIASNVVRKNKAQLIDSPNAYGELLKNGNDYHMGDGIHLNEAGYDLFIKQLTHILTS